MPELAEVEFFRRRWWEAGARETVRSAGVWARSRVFRGLKKEFTGGVKALEKILTGARMAESGTFGKQMWFGFEVAEGTAAKKRRRAGGSAPYPRRLWLGIHLGMTGALRVEGPNYVAQKHDALVMRLAKRTLVFNDPRQFGRVRTWVAEEQTPRRGVPIQRISTQRVPTQRGSAERDEYQARPPWLRNLPAAILSPEFTPERVRGVLARHGRAPLKAVLLNQKYFPGVGNWMADEILWRAALPPGRRAGRTATLKIARALTATIRRVTRDALRVIAGAGREIPSDLNVNIPDTWLFNHRWEDGGVCPKTKQPLRREEIGGRTTCWSPAWQKVRG